MGVAQIKAQELHEAISHLTLSDIEQVLDFIDYLKSRAAKRAKKLETESERQVAIMQAINQLAELGTASRFGDAVEWQREVRQDRLLPERA